MIEPIYQILAEVEAELDNLSYVVDGGNDLYAIRDVIVDLAGYVFNLGESTPREYFLQIAAFAVAAIEVIDERGDKA